MKAERVDGAPREAKGVVLPITAVVLTRDERRNLRACLESIAGRVSRIVVIDSYSSDETVDIAHSFGARVLQRTWRNYADQFQWALDHAGIETEWVLRLDADERWTKEGLDDLGRILHERSVHGVTVRMQIYFMGRFLRHGGMYPNHFLRVFRHSGARIEQRWMDEHVKVEGRVVASAIDVIEANYDRQENIGLWTAKHNAYSTREAVDVLIAKRHLGVDSIADLRGGPTARKRWLKENVYARVPLFVRPFLYFAYRYFFRLGFLDGVPGFVFHVLQGFWYRFLVDVKVYQLEAAVRASGKSVEDVIHEAYGIDIR